MSRKDSQPRDSAHPVRRLRRWAFLLIAALAFLAHARSLTFGFSRIDDDILVIERATFLTDRSHVGEVFAQGYFPLKSESPHYYRPLVTLSYLLDARAPLSPFPYHCTNVLLHVIASALFFSLLLRLRLSLRLAALTAALFAAHPVVTSAVDWIPGRNDSLLACFIFAAWLCFDRWRERRAFRFLAAHVVFFLAALLTKETAVVAPALWLLSTGLDEKRWRGVRDRWLLAGWAVAFSSWVLLRRAAPELPVPIDERLASAWSHLPVLLILLGKIFVPVQLSILANQPDSSLIPGLLALIAVVCAIVTSRNRPLALFGAVMILLFIAPSLLAPGGLLLENRLYLPLAGALLVAASWMQQREPGSTGFLALSCGLLVILFARTWGYSDDYSSALAVGEACIRTAPSMVLSHTTAGNAFAESGDAARAEQEFRRVLELDPRNGVAHNNLGGLAMRRHDLALAQRELREELQIAPDYAPAHLNMGLVLRSQGNAREATTEFARAVELNPENVNALGELFATYSQLGEVENARRIRAQLEREGVRFLNP
jgi:tetratricopeptide (TPR) repeat protein